MQSHDTPKWVNRLLSKIDASGDCWDWTAYVDPKGYAKFQIYPAVHYVHRLVYEWLVGPIPAGYQIDHLCRRRHCVNPDHLEPVPARTNALRGYGAFTTQKHRAKLSDDNKHAMRLRYLEGGISMRALGRLYGVSENAVYRAVHGTPADSQGAR